MNDKEIQSAEMWCCLSQSCGEISSSFF